MWRVNIAGTKRKESFYKLSLEKSTLIKERTAVRVGVLSVVHQGQAAGNDGRRLLRVHEQTLVDGDAGL